MTLDVLESCGRGHFFIAILFMGTHARNAFVKGPSLLEHHATVPVRGGRIWPECNRVQYEIDSRFPSEKGCGCFAELHTRYPSIYSSLDWFVLALWFVPLY